MHAPSKSVDEQGIGDSTGGGPPVTVNRATCVACPKCIESCRFDAIVVISAKAHILENCTGCGACIAACPREAISKVETSYPAHWFFAVDQGAPIPR
ncbi:MAG: 4Fe-4S binding protein [Acidobacteria bacterium]|nr:4Fe-4S binding protein [Acidobacteriota bacterium]